MDEDALDILRRLSRIRVVTAAQARFLFPACRGKSEEAARERLVRLADLGLLERERSAPEQGCVSPEFYRLRMKGLRVIGRECDKHITDRPMWLLDHLLFRNDFVARAYAEGWHFASPVFSDPATHESYLGWFRYWATRQQTRIVEEARQHLASAGRADREQHYLETISTYLPRKLTFEFIVKFRQTHPALPCDLAMVVLDDPRRAIGSPHRLNIPPAQLDDLPPDVFGIRFLVRDYKSLYDPARKALAMGGRIRRWHRALKETYGTFGKDVAIDTELLADAWRWRPVPNRQPRGGPLSPFRRRREPDKPEAETR